MEKLIKANPLKSVIIDTKSFIVWNGSVEDSWNSMVIELYNFTEKSFFLGYVNEYEVEDCGWYLKLLELKVVIDNLYDSISEELNYEYSAYMINQYNKIISHINNEVGYKYFDESYKCDNQYCIFSKNGNCCNKIQHSIDKAEPNHLDCNISIRSDYYDLVKVLRYEASREIKHMELDDLMDFEKRYIQRKGE